MKPLLYTQLLLSATMNHINELIIAQIAQRKN